MRQVWIMNIKDNRENGENLNSNRKFSMCKGRNIIAIGWANSTLDDGETDFITAYHCLCNMKRGDLVWVKEPETKNQYLCEVLNDNVIDLKDEYEDIEKKHTFRESDIASARICEYHNVSDCDILGKINPKQLVVPKTIQRVNDESVIELTKELFDELSGTANEE